MISPHALQGHGPKLGMTLHHGGQVTCELRSVGSIPGHLRVNEMSKHSVRTIVILSSSVNTRLLPGLPHHEQIRSISFSGEYVRWERNCRYAMDDQSPSPSIPSLATSSWPGRLDSKFLLTKIESGEFTYEIAKQFEGERAQQVMDVLLDVSPSTSYRTE